jgi:oligogalacturonide transporter
MREQNVTDNKTPTGSALQPSEELNFWQKLGFGVGDIYGGGSFVVIGIYYLNFLTDVVRINPALAGTVFLISKVYDAITDPFEGILADRTRTPLGRRRPYLLAGILLVFLSFFVLWYPVDYTEEWQRFLFVVLAYLFFSTVVSIVMLSYSALASELTLDYHERTSLSSFRIFFSVVSSLLSAVLPLEIVKRASNVRSGYMTMGLAFGALFALPFIATVASTRERPGFQRERQPFRWRETFVEPFRIRTFLHALLMYLFAFTAIDVVMSLVIYYMKYFLGRGDETNIVSGTLLLAEIAALPFYNWLSRRTSKRLGYIVGASIWILTMLFSFAVVPAAPSFLVYVFAALVGLGTGGIVVMIFAIFPDIPDVDDLKTGQRREGVYSSMVTFTRKLSGAVGLFLVSNGLALAGYVLPVERVVGGVTQLVEQPQSESFTLILRLMFALVPIVLVGLGLLFALRYPLTPEVHRRLCRLLEARRREEPVDPRARREAEDLRRILIGR